MAENTQPGARTWDGLPDTVAGRFEWRIKRLAPYTKMAAWEEWAHICFCVERGMVSHPEAAHLKDVLQSASGHLKRPANQAELFPQHWKGEL